MDSSLGSCEKLLLWEGANAVVGLPYYRLSSTFNAYETPLFYQVAMHFLHC